MKLFEIWDSKIFRQQADAARRSREQPAPQQTSQTIDWQFQPGDRVRFSTAGHAAGILGGASTVHEAGTILHQIPGSFFNKDPNKPLYPEEEKIYQVSWDDPKPDGSPNITYQYEHELEFE